MNSIPPTTGTIENTHGRVSTKLRLVREACETLRDLGESMRVYHTNTSAASAKINHALDMLQLNILCDRADSASSKYQLGVIPILGDYYGGASRTSADFESKCTKSYYRILAAENTVSVVNELIVMVRLACGSISAMTKDREIALQLWDINQLVEEAESIEITLVVEKKNYELCKCGERMIAVAEYSELHCPCGRIKKIVGAVFRDEQFYPQEGQKTKHGSYDISRHCKFWSDRLQGIETKTFDQKTLDAITYVIKRDKYDRQSLNVEQIRTILQDPSVSATTLNNHAALLVKIFGGRSPPQLNFQENKLTNIRFNRAARLHEMLHPGPGNNPYYPHFLYQIWQEMFKDNPEKLRILDYIHMQSWDTLMRNDGYFEELCELAEESDGLKFRPTDPSGRI